MLDKFFDFGRFSKMQAERIVSQLYPGLLFLCMLNMCVFAVNVKRFKLNINCIFWMLDYRCDQPFDKIC